MRFLTASVTFVATILLVGCQGQTAEDGTDAGLQHRIARSIRPAIRADEQTVQELRSRLDQLPPLAPGSRGASAGYHSRYYESRDQPIDIVLDLGKIQPIDRVAVFSTTAVFQGKSIPRYGFPQRFLIEASDSADFQHSHLIADSDELAPIVRPKYPLQIATNELNARYLRFRVLEHWARGDGRFLTALGEIMALSGGRNIAIGAQVTAPSFIALPDWSSENLVDGQTDLGLPIDSRPSHSNGFLSKSQREPKANKWVQLEFFKPVSIEEVRLIPATPLDAPSQHGHGFPRRFRVVSSLSADFSSATVIADRTESGMPNPGNNPIILPADGASALFLRLEVEELWHTSERLYSLALAELQVYADGRNVALRAGVTASDIFDIAPYTEVWKPQFLVDGFSSQNQLIELDDWLEGLHERERTERKIARIENRVERRVEETINGLLLLAATLVVTLSAFTSVTLIRRKRTMVRQRNELRARIARDLHDDLGSRLGGMRLLSESMLASPELPPSMHDDLALISRSSSEATDAMRDIVWLLDNNESSRSKLITHFRQIAPAILGGVACEFEVAEIPEQQLEFDFRRHILFAFKECLGNVAKHAGAGQVHCRIGGEVKRFSFEVRDDGDGFATDGAFAGHGLKNLRDRAAALAGTVEVSSRTGEGTTVIFDVPVQLRRKR